MGKQQANHQELARRIGETFRKGLEWIYTTKGNLCDAEKMRADIDKAVDRLRRDQAYAKLD